MKRVLIISPYFVPITFVGDKRSLYHVRHLPDLGAERLSRILDEVSG